MLPASSIVRARNEWSPAASSHRLELPVAGALVLDLGPAEERRALVDLDVGEVLGLAAQHDGAPGDHGAVHRLVDRRRLGDVVDREVERRRALLRRAVRRDRAHLEDVVAVIERAVRLPGLARLELRVAEPALVGRAAGELERRRAVLEHRGRRRGDHGGRRLGAADLHRDPGPGLRLVARAVLRPRLVAVPAGRHAPRGRGASSRCRRRRPPATPSPPFSRTSTVANGSAVPLSTTRCTVSPSFGLSITGADGRVRSTVNVRLVPPTSWSPT